MRKLGFFKNIFAKVDQLLTGRGKVDEDLFEQLEEALIASDLNVHTTLRVIEDIRKAAAEEQMKTADLVKARLKQSLSDILMSGIGQTPLKVSEVPPTVFLIVGVNGVGKTTSIAKLAYKLKQDGERVVLAAADTFRAAAVDQISLWGERIGVEVVKGREGADPAAVVFDAVQAAKARKADFLLVDTAGRLHNKSHLMEELKKINRVLMRERGGQPADETLLVLDATTGQNAISQAKEFKSAVDITGLILAKLDSTARGGIVVTIKDELNLPIKLIGTGEKPADIDLFDPRDFVEALFE